MLTRVRKQLPVPEAYGDPDFERIWCAWADCDNPASALQVMVECHANPHWSGHGTFPRKPMCAECRRVAFCSAQHADYYQHSHQPGRYGKLSPGESPRYR